MRILLITNPAAGASNRSQINLLDWVTRFAGHTVTIETPKTPDEALRAVQRCVAEGYDRILTMGGDGTINSIVSALAETEIALGIIPTGTVNVLARELGIPLDPLKALEVALAGRIRRLDLGIANGKCFTLMAGLGFDAKVVSEIVPRWKELFGPVAYLTAGLQVLTRYKPSHFTLTLENNTFSLPAWLLVVGNAGYYAYEMCIARDASMDDGMLDVIVFAEQNALDRLLQIGAVFVGRHIDHPNVLYFRTRAITITADPPVTVQLDGDPAGSSPVDISVWPGALSVIVPKTGA